MSAASDSCVVDFSLPAIYNSYKRMLKAKELLDIIEIGRTAMGCDGVGEFGKAVIRGAARAFDVERANFFLIRSYPSPRLDLDHIIVEGIDQEYVDLYRQRYCRMDPFLKCLSASDHVFSTGHVMSARELDRSEYYNNFLRPQSIRYQLIIYLRSNGKLLGTMGFCRAPGEKDFSARDFAKAELLGSQLGGALEKAIFIGKVAKSSEIINSMCTDLPYKGVMVLDESLEPVYMNEEALKAISCLGGGQHVLNDAVPPVPEEVYAMSQNLLESAGAKSGRAPVVKIDLKNKGTGESVSSAFRVINSSQNTHLCLVYFGQNESTALLQQSKKLGLSRRELEVAGLVCEGLENKQIGEKLFISEYTVQNHLKSIYEKLDVRNRTSLAHKVMEFITSR